MGLPDLDRYRTIPVAAPPSPSTPRAVAFDGLTIRYDSRILTPRNWTVAQGRWARELLDEMPAGDVLEVCAGAGQIGLLATRTCPDRRLIGVDQNPAAVHYMQLNAQLAGMEDRVSVREASLDVAVAPDERFPLILADPPWVVHELTGRFPEDPLSAIDGGSDGLEVARRCVQLIEDHLSPGGCALLQVGDLQQAASLRRALGARERLEITETRDFTPRGVILRLDRTDG